jgi:hypothetical protein
VEEAEYLTNEQIYERANINQISRIENQGSNIVEKEHGYLLKMMLISKRASQRIEF